MLTYIFITYDAIEEFVSGRFFQSAEFSDSADLCRVLKGESYDWNHHTIQLQQTSRGLLFYTSKFEKKKGLIFDLETFTGFSNCTDERIIMMFQRILKYAVRYYRKLPVVTCERELPNNTTIVFPFPFTATHDVDKVLIDRNSFKEERKENYYLTVFYFGKDCENKKFFPSNARKVIKEINTIDVTTLRKESQPIIDRGAIEVYSLENLELSIDAEIGYSHWKDYLTEPQRKFVESPITGPERLEGAAGTGKTISLVLRCINLLQRKIEKNQEYHIIFITHSLPTKGRIINIFRNNWPDVNNYLEKENNGRPYISLTVTTLQEWSANHLGTNSITETQYLDKDASDAKELQKMYIEQALNSLYESSLKGLEAICSKEFLTFLSSTSIENKLDMLQQEIAIIIKGRAESDFDKYKKMSRPKYSLPIKNDADKNFMFAIFTKYQEELVAVDQYDSDDIVISALGQIKTPIWQRRRNKEGYDVCFIDETHLFNINELSIFQHINKSNSSNHIIFAIDKSQAVGDLGLEYKDFDHTIGGVGINEQDHKFLTVFRSSPDIVNLAFNVLSSGATLFTNFENPLDYSTFNFTREEENKCLSPIYHFSLDDDTMIQDTFRLADEFCKEKKCPHSNVLIATTTTELLEMAERYAIKKSKPFIKLKGRNDINSIQMAKCSSRYILGGIDFVGGLEFDAVFILGVDKNRVPPAKGSSDEAFHFLDYAWHNRLYVAITRAKYHVCILGIKSRGESSILESAIYTGLLKKTN